MTHCKIGPLADMVRGVAAEKDQAEMSAHLSGCRTCRRTEEILRKVAGLAAWDVNHQVPAYAVHSARSIFALRQPEKVYFFPRVMGQLIYDSFKEPLPAGLRARHRLTRHVLYQAGDYSMDLRIEHQQGATGVTLVGQIVDQGHPDVPPAEVPVFLVSGETILAHCCSNVFGEFQLEYEPQRHLHLYLQGGRDFQGNVELPLDHLSMEVTSRRTKRNH